MAMVWDQATGEWVYDTSPATSAYPPMKWDQAAGEWVLAQGPSPWGTAEPYSQFGRQSTTDTWKINPGSGEIERAWTNDDPIAQEFVWINGKEYGRPGDNWEGVRAEGVPVEYDETQGYISPAADYRAFLERARARNKDGFGELAKAFGSTIGLGMGVSGLIGSGLGMAANAGYAGAGEALANSGYQSLWSSLGQNAASQGGSLTDLMNAYSPAGTGGSMQLPASYGNMLAGEIPEGFTVSNPGTDTWANIYNEAQSGAFNPVTGAPNPSLYNAGTGLMDFSTPVAGSIAQTTPGLALDALSTAGGLSLAPGAGLTGSASGLSLSGLLNNPSLLKTLVGAGASLGGAALQSNAIGKATDAQLAGVNAANAAQLAMYEQNREDLAPWRNAGAAAVGRLGEMLKPGYQFNAADADPGYQFRMDQGQKLLERSRAAAGNLYSGATGKALTRYGQDYASNEFTNSTNRLANLAGLGQAATNTTVNAGQNTANITGQNTLGAANARASGYVGNANLFGSGLSSLLRNMQEQELVDLLKRGAI